MPEGDELREKFLEMLKGGGQSSGDAPAPPGAESSSAPDAVDPTAQEPAPVPTPEPAPLTYEQQPPPPEEVPAAMAALAADPQPAPAAPAPAPAGGNLMDLGHDAQLQGTALGLRSVANRLAVISEGLKLIPALQNISRDLENLNYGQVAAGVDALITWAKSEEQALMTELEERTATRQGPAPAQ